MVFYFIGMLDKAFNCETVGYFEKFEDAAVRIEANKFDIYENGCYPYAVVEEVQANCIYPKVEVKAFFTWKDGRFQKTPVPEKLKGLCNFTIK